MDHLFHAGHRPHPAGLLCLHRATAGGRGASGEEHDAAAGEQDQAAAEHAAGKNSLPMMDDGTAITGPREAMSEKKRLLIEGTTLISQCFSVQFTDISKGLLPGCTFHFQLLSILANSIVYYSESALSHCTCIPVLYI